MTRPLGVIPWPIWWEAVDGDPDLGELLQRYRELDQAVDRYRAAGRDIPKEWRIELGLTHLETR